MSKNVEKLLKEVDTWTYEERDALSEYIKVLEEFGTKYQDTSCRAI